jgi:hypothetical protein
MEIRLNKNDWTVMIEWLRIVSFRRGRILSFPFAGDSYVAVP